MLFKSEIVRVSYTQNVYEIVFEFALINEISQRLSSLLVSENCYPIEYMFLASVISRYGAAPENSIVR